MALESPINTRMVLLMGVSGSGKTRLGKTLAESLGGFADADDYRHQSNRAQMALGHPYTDADQEPWLLRELIEQHLRRNQPLVLACWVLKEHYQEALTSGLEAILSKFLARIPRTHLVFHRGYL